MNPTRIKGANRFLGAPPNWDESRNGPCETLPVRENGPMLQSAWLPTPEELLALNSGHPVILTVWQQAHPVVSLGVEVDARLAAPSPSSQRN